MRGTEIFENNFNINSEFHICLMCDEKLTAGVCALDFRDHLEQEHGLNIGEYLLIYQEPGRKIACQCFVHKSVKLAKKYIFDANDIVKKYFPLELLILLHSTLFLLFLLQTTLAQE